MQRHTINWTGLPGGPAVSVLHSIGVGQDDAEGFANDITNVLSTLAPAFHEDVRASVDPLVREINVATDEATAFWTVDVATVVGGQPADLLPSNIAMLVQFRTPGVRRGRRVQGRLFLPGLTEASNADGRPQTDGRSAVATAFRTLMNPGSNTTLAVYSRPIDGGEPGQLSAVTEVAVWQEWAQLGKRRQ